MLRISSRYRTFRSMSREDRLPYYRVRARRAAWRLWRLLFYPAYYPIAWILGRLGVRFLVSRHGRPRIGHLGWEQHFFVKARLIGYMPNYRAVMLGSRGMVANESLRDYWRPFITVISNPLVEFPLRPLAWMGPVRYQMYPQDVSIPGRDGQVLEGYRAYDQVFVNYYERFGGSKLFGIRPEHEARGRAELERLGMPRDAWFVTLHVREDGYIPSPNNRLRNGDILDYLEAVKLITSRGGWVVRAGDPTMTPLPELPDVIDYVHTDARSDWMDVFLLGACRFYLGSDSGPSVVPGIFGRPCAIVGGIPMGHGTLQPDGIYIKKMYRSVEDGRMLTFPEVLLSSQRDLGTVRQFTDAGLTWIDNSPDEIKALTAEMLDRLDRKAAYTEEDKRLQETFRSLLLAKITKSTFGTGSRIGRDFLRKHKALLEAPSLGSDNS